MEDQHRDGVQRREVEKQILRFAQDDNSSYFTDDSNIAPALPLFKGRAARSRPSVRVGCADRL